MITISKDSVTYIAIDEQMSGQRLDNFLLRILKGVPKSHIYRIIRAGEVRVNKGRIAVDYRLQTSDLVRVPPVRIAETVHVPSRITDTLAAQHHIPVVYEDEALLVIDKPAGLAVHGGSNVSFGLIELLRKQRADSQFLELAHRLDRETSGLILIAKKRNALVALHQAMRNNAINKRYLAMVYGTLTEARRVVKLHLFKYLLPNGERRVRVAEEGQFSHTIFTHKDQFTAYSLVEAELKTGRTHQIRVHLASMGLPILGDDKYGDFALNKTLPTIGLNRMFLHAYRLTFQHPLTQEKLSLTIPLPPALQQFMDQLHGTKTTSI
jgi:23S rRNA pseudouridine955/2504/2580 synthase